MLCNDCHTGAVANSNAGTKHVDGFVNTSSIGGGKFAIAKHAANTFTTSCATTYCHGNGDVNNTNATLKKALPAGAIGKTTPTWGGGVMNCNSCHGAPPLDPSHFNTSTSSYVAATSCSNCHNHVNTNGTSFNDISKHVDGIIQGGSCDSCHGYPPVQSMAGLGVNANYSSAKLQNYSGGGGVHSVAGHLALTLKNSQGNGIAACLACHPDTIAAGTHNQGSGAFLTANVQVQVNAKYKFDKNRPIVYSGKQSGTGKTTGTCANVECHFQKSPPWTSQPYTQGH
jgi:predicted CxxxxCH...CXXCH cytochrome family protein